MCVFLNRFFGEWFQAIEVIMKKIERCMYYLFIVSLCFYMLTLLHMVAHLLMQQLESLFQ